MSNIKQIIHCADIHIRNFVRLEEYSEQLEKFIEKCKELCNGFEKDEVRIVISGDLVHSKNTLFYMLQMNKTKHLKSNQ